MKKITELKNLMKTLILVYTTQNKYRISEEEYLFQSRDRNNDTDKRFPFRFTESRFE
jgi:hypothetical protein